MNSLPRFTTVLVLGSAPFALLDSYGLEPDCWFWLFGLSGWFFLVLVCWLGAACLGVRLISSTPF